MKQQILGISEAEWVDHLDTSSNTALADVLHDMARRLRALCRLPAVSSSAAVLPCVPTRISE